MFDIVDLYHVQLLALYFMKLWKPLTSDHARNFPWQMFESEFHKHQSTKLQLSYETARLFCGRKYRRNSIENDYCSGKPDLSPLPLILTLTLTLRTLLTLTLTLRTLLTVIDSPQTLVYRRNSHFRCCCGSIYRRKRFILWNYVWLCTEIANSAFNSIEDN